MRDIVRRFCPDEGLGLCRSRKVWIALLQFASGAEAGSSDLLFCEGGKPPLDQVEPTGRGGRKVHMKAWALQEPPLNRRCLVSGVVVQNQVHVQFGGHVALNRIEELAELLRPVAAIRFAKHGAGFRIERREQRRGAVPFVVVSAPFRLSHAQGL